jgi:hypothetical protein
MRINVFFLKKDDIGWKFCTLRLNIYNKFNKNDQWARSIFDMLYLLWSDQKVIKG